MPARFAPALFGLILSGMMSLIVSGIATLRAAPLDGIVAAWLGEWLISWAIAFPVVMVVAPFARRLVGLLVATPATQR